MRATIRVGQRLWYVPQLLVREETSMFCKHEDQGYRQLTPGIRVKTLTYGEKTLCVEFRLDQGSTLPRHAHPHEQIGYLVAGRLRLTVGAEVLDAGPGDSWCIPGNVEHGAETLADSVAFEVFAPVREDYLPEKPACP
jgi:quercetin dioxygenase-like cupin family protein